MAPKEPAPVHPGEVLLEEFGLPMEVSQCRLAKDISVSPRRINEIVHGQRSITAHTALLRPARDFGTPERPWPDPQTGHDLEGETGPPFFEQLNRDVDGLLLGGQTMANRPRLVAWRC